MGPQALISFALESAIGAELMLFSIFLLSKSGKTAAQYVLASLTLILAAIIIANLLIGVGAWSGLSSGVLFADLLVAPLFYLYVRLAGPASDGLKTIDTVHAAPATVGLGCWLSGLFQSMDVYVIGCWSAYLTAAAYQFYRHHKGYASAPLRHFIGALIALFGVTIGLRTVMAAQSGHGQPFIEGVPYLIVLLAIFLITSQLLFTALRHRDLFCDPQGEAKYLNYPVPEAELEALAIQFAALIEERRPYLDPNLTLAGLAVMVDASPRCVSQFVNTTFGLNVSAYLNRCRVGEAVRLLTESPRTPIKVVMFESGFKTKSIFNREFQRCLGVSPTAFRLGLQKGGPPMSA